MRARFVLLAMGCLLAACKNDGAAGSAQVDPSQLNSSGEVALSDGTTMAFSITSERYKQWDSAQRALDRRTASRFGALLRPASPTERSISGAVSFLEQDAVSRQVIERSGLTVRGFVELTVALEQQMRLASKEKAARPEPMPMPAPYPPPVDSGYVPARPIVPMPVVAPSKQREQDSTWSSDSLFPAPRMRDSTPRPDTLTARRDTAAPR